MSNIDDLIQRLKKAQYCHVDDIIREWAGEQASTITHECGNCDMSWNEGEAPKHRTDCIAYVAPQPVAGDVREKVAQEMKTSGLRGRGGAGFPTGLKSNLWGVS